MAEKTAREKTLRRVCVFCGSSMGNRPEYRDAAAQLAGEMVARGIGLVFGGGSIGLMTAVADAMLALGGDVIGVIPQALVEREVAHRGLRDLRIVNSMHERKALMAELSDAFLAMPGGFGTFEEFCEVVTWTQLGIHRKPCGLLNVAGYYDGLLAFLAHALREEFLRPTHFEIVVAGDDAEQLVDRMLAWQPPFVTHWIGQTEA
jgi:uncharacterized protein (TIGR00730 family)